MGSPTAKKENATAVAASDAIRALKAKQNNASPKKKSTIPRVSTASAPPSAAQRPVESETKVNLGKANLWRELGIPFAGLLFGIMICSGLKDIGKSSGDKKKTWDKQLMDLLAKKTKMGYDRRGGASSPNCTMFYSKSSIPGAGFSVFAGRDYDRGDIVFPAGDFLPTRLDSQDENDSALRIQQSAYLLKYHHLVSNLKGQSYDATMASMASSSSSEEDYNLRASKPIQAGDELLLPFSQHPKSQIKDTNSSSFRYFDSIPTLEDYKLAEQIVRDQVEHFKFKRGRKQQKATNTERTFKLLHKSIFRLNTKVASLLPMRKDDLDKLAKNIEEEPFALGVLEAKSVEALEMNAKCLSYTKANPQSTGVVTTREFHEGSMIAPIPLLVLSTRSRSGSDDRSCSSESEVGECAVHTMLASSSSSKEMSRCLSHKGLPFLLCPLLQADRITVIDATISDGEGPAPNVEYKWSTWNAHNTKSHGFSSDAVARFYTTQLSLDLIALRDIEEGEDLVIKLEPGLEGTFGSVPDDLIPGAWKLAIE